jgi:hypothetical protein
MYRRVLPPTYNTIIMVAMRGDGGGGDPGRRQKF